ncbi:Dynein light chain type 1 family protein [Hibiscus syriacus]|uniref:Dynein light chain type 1 family protein n=1 Tax=Hibiscus syriacus TaxID=106335 RepID=A0A6A3C555_HIBSY|nr:Dynein light chain type 1 family protein [Hibiscus syriacus]
MGRRLFACFGGGSSKKGVHANGKTDGTVVEAAAGDGPVLVELFSSQGCATSPVVELLLSRLGRGDFQLDTPFIALAYHVDYWDHMGWKDPYGSSLSTVVVQGRAQCVGNDEDTLLSTISSAPRFPAPSFQANFQRPTSESLQVTLTGALRSKVDNNGVNVMVALYENGLVNDCLAGENRGKVLSNDFVVRKLEKLCTVKDISAKKTVSGTATFTLWDGFNSEKCALAVFVQNSSHQIIGSQKFELPNDL